MPKTGELDRSECPAPVHGTLWAYSNRCRCADAKHLKARYTKHRAAGLLAPARLDATGAKRRLRALQAIGHSLTELAQRLGYTSEASFSRLFAGEEITRERHQRIAELYEELCMRPGTSRRSMTHARRKGWPPPLAWDDIDHDPAPPAVEPDRADQVDSSAVARAVAGEPPANLRRIDRLAAVAELVRRRESTLQIADKLGVGPRRVNYDRADLRARGNGAQAARTPNTRRTSHSSTRVRGVTPTSG